MMKAILLQIFIFFTISLFAANPAREIIIVDNQQFFVHTINQGETLYRISKKYDVTINEIEAANSGVKSETIQPNMVIRIPVKVKILNEISSPKMSVHVIYRVKKGETLFTIAKRHFNTEVHLIKRNNSLGETPLSVGQVLIVGYLNPTQEELAFIKNAVVTEGVIPETLTSDNTPVLSEYPSAIITEAKIDVPKVETEATEVKSADSFFGTETKTDSNTTVVFDSTKNSIEITETISDSTIKFELKDFYAPSSLEQKEIQERGMGTQLPGNKVKGMLILHRNAPEGTVMKVKNLMNNKEVYVKVAGKVPAEFSNILTMVPEAVAKKLGVLDPRFLVSTYYYGN